MTFEGALAGLPTLGHPEVCLLQWGSLLVNVFIGSPSKSVSTDRSDCSHQMAWHALPHWHWMVGWVQTCRGFTDLRSVRSSAEEDCLACTIQRWTIRLQTRREQKSFCSRIHQSMIDLYVLALLLAYHWRSILCHPLAMICAMILPVHGLLNLIFGAAKCCNFGYRI